MPRREAPIDDEKRSYGAVWLLCSLLLFVGALWCIADDNIFRRPWKKFQAEFNRLEIRRLKDAIADEQQRLDADPAYQQATKALAEARASVSSGDNARKIADLQRKLRRAQQEDQSKDLNLRFIKSELEELRFKYDDALHAGRPTEALLKEIEAKEQLRAERQRIYSESQQRIDALQNEIKQIEGAIQTAEEGIAKLTTARDDLQQKLEGVSIGYFPGPKAAPPFFGFERPLLRGEKKTAQCIKCHAGVQNLEAADEIGRGERLFEQLGCHGCHLTEGYEDLAKIGGVTSIAPSLRRIGAKVDHGWLVRWIKNPHEFRPRTRMPNFMFDEEQAVQIAAFLLSDTKQPSEEWLAAHAAPASAAGGELAAKGKALVETLGCRACHAITEDEVAGQLGANKDIAPNLAKVAEKTDARWIYHWLKNPRGYSPVARMPRPRTSDDEARAIAAYLATLGEKRPASAQLETRLADPASAEAGEKLVRKYGCAGCHDVPGMENESRIGVELSAFGSKTREELFFGDRTDVPETWDDWTYNKLATPRTYATKWIEQVMPQFDLAEEDIKALRAFLSSRTDSKVPVKYLYRPPGEDRIVAGRRLVARYNCTGCHVIEGRGGDIRRLYQEQPTLAPPILNGEGEKVQADWLFNFVKAPVPIRPWLQLRMPTFGLADEEANTVVGYFEALDRVQVPFVHLERAALSTENVEAGKLLTSKDYFDCFSCHQRGAQKPQGPPEGWAPDLALAHARLSPEWIVKWLHDPQKVMPGTKMPSFFPGGPPDVLGGDDEAQIRALRDYVVWLGLPDVTLSPQQAAGVTSAGPGASQ